MYAILAGATPAIYLAMSASACGARMPREAVIALLFAAANAAIFWWR